ncbi:Cys-tRNA(Pro) deacylase [Rhodococcus wratislaviensis]|uniref:Cys-tRNA(Pro)/Cys-tRNA(Cys) deacylase n=1 Tax=Rhodococcus wratislaviensis NBRC 100605 TaxID=1219028 RepID=X0RJA8_RHOWR|nr:Cys-tRNA(Pro) deacylase [Rhodococcus wratislaviensis]GAF51175.1 putative aminoacyl-tRNA deacylase [Rhodococcus wratislaviensis NBRC 100605]
MAGTATPATKLLVKHRIDHTVHSYAHDARAESYGSEAVDALGETVGVTAHQVFKTLVIKLDTGKLAVAVLPVPEKLSLKAAAAALGAGKAVMAERTDAERSTGYVFGGISPLGQRKALPTVVDASALDWDRVLCSAGRRGLEIELAPADLVRLSGAVTAAVTAG